MPFTITLPEGYQYTITVGKYRRRAGVKYPQAYAEKAEQEKSKDAMKFNCAQRAHQNTLESLPTLYATTILSGLNYPHFAAAACMAFVVGRIAYTRGYISGDPEKRSHPLSGLGTFALISQMFAATYTVGGWLLPGLFAKISR